MKCIILSAGKGTRMRELAINTPKPLLLYKEKTLLEHKFEALPDSITDIVLVIGYLGDKIKEYFGDSWNGKKIHYVTQEEMLGTGHAIWTAKEVLDSPFMVLMGDDLYAKEDMEKMIQHFKQNNEWSVLVEKPEGMLTAGKIVQDENGNLKDIIEDKEGTMPGFVYTGACFLTPELFKYELVQLPGSKEFGLPQTFVQAVSEHNIKIHETSFWKRITAPEDLE